MPAPSPESGSLPEAQSPAPELDLAEIHGQEAARRALEVAASGGHHLLMWGPPGAGKTMLARCLPGLLPPLTLAEALEVAEVRSVLDVRGALAAHVSAGSTGPEPVRRQLAAVVSTVDRHRLWARQQVIPA